MDETVASQFVHVGCSVSGRAGDFSDKAAPYKLVGGTLTSAVSVTLLRQPQHDNLISILSFFKYRFFATTT